MADDRRVWSDLPTEARHPASRDLDLRSPEEVVRLLVEEDRRGVGTVLDHAAELARAAVWLAETLQSGGRAVLAGAGTSGRLAVIEDRKSVV